MRFLILIIALFQFGCSNNSADNTQFAFVNSTSKTNTTCSISSGYPSSSSLKIGASSFNNIFSVSTSAATCSVTWQLNGQSVGTGFILSLDGSQLSSGTNTLIASSGSNSLTWTITKNNPPICGIMNPSSSGLSMYYTQTQNFSVLYYDPDNQAVNVTWLLNNNSSTEFSSALNSGNSASVTFNPVFQNIGSNSITAQLDDGYDKTNCSWSITVSDPSALTIASCPANWSSVSPNIAASGSTINELITSSGTNSNQNLQINAVGSGVQYVWKKNGSIIGGATTPLINLSSASLAVGTYTYHVDVTDAYSHTGFCEWTVKRNAPPVISSYSPNNSTNYFNYLLNGTLSVSASNADGDPLTYTWTLNSLSQPSYLSSGASSALLTPNVSIIGNQVATVTVSDGYESVSQSFNLNINGFSTYCNTLLNNSSGSGSICTIAGSPSVGIGMNSSSNPSLQLLKPSLIIQDQIAGSNGYYISSINPYGVYYWNLGSSSVIRNGILIISGNLELIAGEFASGVASDTGSTTSSRFKIGNVAGLAQDPVTGYLYISDSSNNRVYQIDSSGNLIRFFGTGFVTNNTGTNTAGQAGTSTVCNTPRGLAIQTVQGLRTLFVTCQNSNAIKSIVIDQSSGSYNKMQIVVGALSGGSTVSGYTDGIIGPTGTALADQPLDVQVDSNGIMYWIDRASNQLRAANLSGSATTLMNGAISLPANQTVSIAGVPGSGVYNINSGSRTIAYNSLTMGALMGVSLYQSGGSVLGFFIFDGNANGPLFINNSSASINFGGVNIGVGQAGYLFGGNGFRDGTSTSALFSNLIKGTVTQDQSTLLIPDYNNFRIRSFTLSSSGLVSTIYGEGLTRQGSKTFDTSTSVTSIGFNYPYNINIDRTNNIMYIVDQTNGKIKQLNLTTGFISTYVGSGIGSGASTNNQSQYLTTLLYPHSVISISNGTSSPYLIWTETNSNTGSELTTVTGAGNPCLVRALNPTTTTQTIFGQTINPQSVSVIAGEYALGCGSFVGVPGAGASAEIESPESLLYSNGNLYIVHTTAHCITRLDSSGNLSVFAGTCDTIGATGIPSDSGGVSNPTFRYPTYMVEDPLNSGNFLVADEYDSVGVIRYINTKTSSVTYRGYTIPAASSGGIMVKTVLTDPSSMGRINSIAVFNTGTVFWTCFSTGQTDNGTTGSHSVYCYDNLGVSSYTINTSTQHGKSPQDYSEEGILANNASLYAPQGVDFDSSGNLYIVERSGSLIRIVKRWF